MYMAKVEIVEIKNYKFLFLDDYLWMWDLPHEQELQRNIANQAFGDVLVAGYGFGIVSKYLLENPRVNSVTTIEKYADIIDRMKEFGPIYGEIVIADFFDLPEDKKYDCVVGDIWAEIDAQYLDDYIRFKTKAQKLVKPNGLILGWGKDYFEYLLEKEKSAH
jgi:spermidine synthase